MNELATAPVVVREDGYLSITRGERHARRLQGRAKRRGLDSVRGTLHIAAGDNDGTTLHLVPTHVTDDNGETIVDFRDAA
ncbi:hypothetical protein [Corynebacterium glyciniphilum]|uniref:hypothetical protein n=1 Tax=Corynebacterium glyciniphilum TaxID=1404244 RepID=UPI002654274E|nr:hypothetical protein [Corynebacterium glyciniphilum]MDN6706391.1 hypothetical protein [Corynebacterium glyciniphilum]